MQGDLGDRDAAAEAFRAAAATDRTLAAKAGNNLGKAGRLRDVPGARAAYERAVGMRDPGVSAKAAWNLFRLRCARATWPGPSGRWAARRRPATPRSGSASPSAGSTLTRRATSPCGGAAEAMGDLDDPGAAAAWHVPAR